LKIVQGVRRYGAKKLGKVGSIFGYLGPKSPNLTDRRKMWQLGGDLQILQRLV